MTHRNPGDVISKEIERMEGIAKDCFKKRLDAFCPELSEEIRDSMALSFAMAMTAIDPKTRELAKDASEAGARIILSSANNRDPAFLEERVKQIRKLVDDATEDFQNACLVGIMESLDALLGFAPPVSEPAFMPVPNNRTLH